jgi:hypothetical protein
MALLLDRKRRAGRYLEWKVRIFAAGAVLGLAGILLDEAWLRIAAILVLAVGVVLRVLPGGTGRPQTDGDPADREAEEEEAEEEEDEEVRGPA